MPDHSKAAIEVHRILGPGGQGELRVVAARLGAGVSYRATLAAIPATWPGAVEAANRVAAHLGALFQCAVITYDPRRRRS